MALAGNNLDELVPSELQAQWNETKLLWFPRTDTAEHAAYDKRTPGNFIFVDVIDSVTFIFNLHLFFDSSFTPQTSKSRVMIYHFK